MKKKILFSPLLIIALIALLGVGAAGAAIYLGNSGDSNSLGINLQKNLKGWWKLDGNAKDSSPYSNNGTVTGAILTTDRKGTANRAYSFTGTNPDYIHIAYNSAFDLGTKFTVGFWYKKAAIPGWVKIISGRGDSDQGWEIAATGDSGEFAVEGWGTATTGGPQSTSGVTTVNGTWYYVVVTGDGINCYIYVNNVQRGSFAYSNSFNLVNHNLRIGKPENFNEPITGVVDDVRFYSRTLTSAERTALYESYDPGIQVSDLQKGLMGWWKFDGNAKDFSPYGSIGTITGATLDTDRKGQVNRSYSFNGSSDFISETDNDSLEFGTGNFTISLWAKFNALPANGTHSPFASRYVDGNNNWSFSVYNNAGSYMPHFYGFKSSTNFNSSVSLPSLSSGVWHHFLVNRTGSTITFYVDGTSYISGGTNSQDLTYASSLFIGKSAQFGTYFNGNIDDVRAYNRALSSAEVTALYQEYDPGIQVSNLSKGLVGHWKMDGNAKDFTPYGNNGTVTGATLTTDRKGQVNRAYSFDGSSSYINAGTGASLDIATTGKISVSAWIKTNVVGTGTGGPIFSRYGGSPQNGYELRFEGFDNGYMMMDTVVNDSWVSAQEIAPLISAGQWYHIVGTYDGTNMRFYKNGVLERTQPSSVPNASTVNAIIGRRTALESAPHIFNGVIDDVRVYNRALNQTEITALYESY